MTKVIIDTGEQYPALFIYEPDDPDEAPYAVEIPAEMWERLIAARNEVEDAELVILHYLDARSELPERVRMDHLGVEGDST
jgi:hypothetical protein